MAKRLTLYLYCSGGDKKGFSLLEVLIALAIFAISAFGIYGLLNECIYAQNFAQRRLELVLASTNLIFPAINNLPEPTDGWVYLEDNPDIEAQRISKESTGMYGIIKTEWDFKKGKITIGYTFYEK